MSGKGGVHMSLDKALWIKRLKITHRSRAACKMLTPGMISQLHNCKDDSARRLLLGLSIKGTTPAAKEPRMEIGRSYFQTYEK